MTNEQVRILLHEKGGTKPSAFRSLVIPVIHSNFISYLLCHIIYVLSSKYKLKCIFRINACVEIM